MKEADKNIGGEVKNLNHQQAIEKCKELVKHNAVCMFTTKLASLPLTTRPMSAQQVDDDGNFWFLSADDSNKNYEIGLDSRVQLFFQNVSDFEFMSVYGNAYISRDKKKIDELWTPIAKAWFSEGKEDPRVTVIKIQPEEAFYWDTKSGKIVSMFKILASAVIGKTLSEGVEGTLSVN
jgi:general stress protein 26